MNTVAAAISIACWLRISRPKMRRWGSPAMPSAAGSKLQALGAAEEGGEAAWRRLRSSARLQRRALAVEAA